MFGIMFDTIEAGFPIPVGIDPRSIRSLTTSAIFRFPHTRGDRPSYFEFIASGTVAADGFPIPVGIDPCHQSKCLLRYRFRFPHTRGDRPDAYRRLTRATNPAPGFPIPVGIDPYWTVPNLTLTDTGGFPIPVGIDPRQGYGYLDSRGCRFPHTRGDRPE